MGIIAPLNIVVYTTRTLNVKNLVIKPRNTEIDSNYSFY